MHLATVVAEVQAALAAAVREAKANGAARDGGAFAQAFAVTRRHMPCRLLTSVVLTSGVHDDEPIAPSKRELIELESDGLNSGGAPVVVAAIKQESVVE